MLDAGQKYDLLKTLYLENNKELIFWRERNWNTMKLVIGADVVLAGLAIFQGAPVQLSILVIALAIISSIYLHKNYGRYQEKRLTGARIEKALELFDGGVFMAESVLPQEFSQPRADRRGSYSFITAIWLVAVAAVAAILGTQYHV